MTPLRMTTRRIAAAALAVGALLAAPASAEDRTLKQWVDDNGVTHLTLAGPSKKARQKAASMSVARQSDKKTIRIRETSEWDVHIALAAEKYGIPQALVRAVIVAESNFDPKAVSRVGARGLMQLMPATAAEMFVADSFDPIQNIYGGTRYLRILANTFDGDLVKTIAAYNAGPNAVRRANGVPNFKETQEYVRRVLRFYNVYRES